MGFIVNGWHDNLPFRRARGAAGLLVGDSDKLKARALPLNLVAKVMQHRPESTERNTSGISCRQEPSD